MSYAPNGDLVTGNPDGTVTFWNPATGTQRGPSVLVSTGPVTSIAFDQAGGRFATAGLDDGTVKLWSTTSLQQIGTALPTDPGSGATVAFSPTGAHLFALDGAGSAFTRPASVAAWEQAACTIAGRPMSRAEFHSSVDGDTYNPVCP